MLKDWCVTFIRPASVSSDIKLNLTKLWNTVKDFICCFIKLSQRPRKTLHCLNTYLRLSRIGLCSLAEIVFTYCSEYFTSMVWVFPEEVCPYAKIVPLYPHRTSMGKKQNDKWDQSAYISNIWHILTWLIIRTFHNLLGAGVVHLLLGGVGRKHSIKRIGLPLWRAQTTAFIRKRAISSQTGHAGVLKMLQCLWFWTMLFITKEDEHQQSEKALRCCVLPASQRHILCRTFQLQITDQGRFIKCSFSRRLLALHLTWEQSRMRDSMGH